MKHISPINDFFFRFLFGKAGHEPLTLDFVNSVLLDSGFGPLKTLVIKNPFNVKESVTDKETVLDIKAEDEQARVYNIEMQLQGNALFANRSLYYWSKCYAGQIGNGDDYKKLSPVICMNILNFELFSKAPGVHHCFLLKELNHPDLVLTDHQMIHFMDLTQFRKMRYTVKCQLSHWLTYFCLDEDNMKGLETILENNPAIKKAHALFEEFTADKEMMERYEARQKYLRDVSTIKSFSHDEGYIKGKTEGKIEGIIEGEAKGKAEMVISMYQESIDIPTIAKVANLSVEEINQILNIHPASK